MSKSRDRNPDFAQQDLLRDEELCRLAAGRDSDAETELVRRYGWLVRACARPLFLAGGDSEDLIQEGMMGLLTAIRTFDPGRDAAFRTLRKSVSGTGSVLPSVRRRAENTHR